LNPAAPAFATGTRVAGVVLIVGYLSGLVPGQIVSLVGGLALITFGRMLLLERKDTAVAGAALAVAAGSFGIPALRWGTLSLESLVGAQSVIGPTILVGPETSAIAAGVALGAALVAIAAWSTQPVGVDKTARAWGRVEGVVAVLAATLVFAAPGAGGSMTELFGDPVELAPTAATIAAGAVIVLLAPKVLRSRKAHWIVLALCGVAVGAAAALVAGAL
jgi:hypothetical protein